MSVKARLPLVLEEEVQLRLPAKSLVRFESVCKEWRSRFESRPFIDSYAQRRPRVAFNDFSSKVRTSSAQELLEMVPGLDSSHRSFSSSVGFGPWGRAVLVYGPLSNGIYCLISHDKRLKNNGCCPVVTVKIALCNPGIGQYRFADNFDPEFRTMLSETFSKSSSSDPPSRLYFGFGSVSKIGSLSLDYRVVVIVHYGSRIPYSFLVFVYSFQRRKWRKIVDYRAGRKKIGKPKALAGFDLPQGRRIISICAPWEGCRRGFLEGCYHWAVIHQDGSFSVLAFKFADYSFRLIRGPPDHMDLVVEADDQVMYDGNSLVLHDHLAFIRCFSVPVLSSSSPEAMRTVEIGVWMMMEYGVEQSWTRVYTMNPEFKCLLNGLLDGIDYEEDPCTNNGGGIRIKGLLLKVVNDEDEDDYKQEVVYCDDNGGHQVITSTSDRSRVSVSVDEPADGHVVITRTPISDPADEGFLCWNTRGISTYIETLERV